MPDKSAWNNFLETGRIDDYLNYCQDRKRELFMSFTEGASDAADGKRHSVVQPQDG